MRSSDWSSDVCSSDLRVIGGIAAVDRGDRMAWQPGVLGGDAGRHGEAAHRYRDRGAGTRNLVEPFLARDDERGLGDRSEEHTSELQSLMRISYAVFCLKKKTTPPITLHLLQV